MAWHCRTGRCARCQDRPGARSTPAVCPRCRGWPELSAAVPPGAPPAGFTPSSLAGFTEDHLGWGSRATATHPRPVDVELLLCGARLVHRQRGLWCGRTRRRQRVAGLGNPYSPHGGVAIVGALAFQCGKNAAYSRGQYRVLSYRIPAAMSTVVVAAHELVDFVDQDLVRQGQPPLDHITLRHPPFRSRSLLLHRRLGPPGNPGAPARRYAPTRSTRDGASGGDPCRAGPARPKCLFGVMHTAGIAGRSLAAPP